jgi:hypothetical protein
MQAFHTASAYYSKYTTFLIYLLLASSYNTKTAELHPNPIFFG